MNERKRLQKAIAELEAQRGTLSDEAIEASIAALQHQLDDLEAPEQQRKLVTILFADIVDSTKTCQHLDPEEVMQLMDGVLKRLALPVEKHGGHVTRFMGDGFMAVFGAPVALENDPEMAVRAGLGITALARELAHQLQTDWNLPDFKVRVGINTGLVVLGGQTEAQDTIMGSTVNLAARLESAAPPGTVLISNDTCRHVRGIFDLQPQPPVSAKGFDQPVDAYRVLRARPRAFRLRTRGVEGIETRMVGREAELLNLQNAYQAAVEGQQTHVVTVVGEAGVGKSRLLYEFDNWIHQLPAEVHIFQGRGRQETQNQPFTLLRDLFTYRFQIQESDRARMVRQKIESGFGDVFGADDQGHMKAHLTAQLLGYDFSRSPHLKGVLDDPPQLRERAQVYLEEFFQGLSQSAPTLVYLEDIHWADDSSLDMLNHLVQNLPHQRLLFICLARYRLFDRRPYWGEGLGTHRRLELLPLSKHHSCQLVKEILLKVEDVPETLGDLVVNGAEGNPFYIEELIKMLIEEGVIRTGPDQWCIALDRLSEFVVPPTLSGVLQARLESLPSGERITLQQASVVGRIFWDDTVDYINKGSSPDDPQTTICTTEENLSSLRTRELVYRHEVSAFSDACEYIFKHAMLREVTYESVLKRLRRLYHGLVADWLIQHRGDRVAEYTGLIAEHLALAGLKDQTVLYLRMAGDQAVKQFANEEAIGYYRRAVGLLAERTSEDIVSVEMLPEVYESLGDVHSAIGGHEQARQAFENANALIPPDELLWRARIQRKIGRTWQDQDKVEESKQAFDAAEGMLEHKPAESSDLWWQEWLWIQLNRMFGLYAQAQSEEMADLLAKVQPIIEQFGTMQQIDAFYASKIMMIYRRDRYVISEELLAIARKHLSLAMEIGDQRKIAEAQFGLGFALLWYGALDEAESALQQALRTAEQASHRYYLTLCLTYLTIVYRKKSTLEKTQDYLQKSIVAATNRQMPGYIATAQANQAWLDWRAGDLEAAEQHGRQALAGWKQLTFVVAFQWTALWPLMAIALEKDHIEQAIAYAGELLAPEQQALPQAATLFLQDAIQAWQDNQPEVTRQNLEGALALAQEIQQL